MELTKNEYAIAQALYSNVDIDSVLLSFRYEKNKEAYEYEMQVSQRLVRVKEIHPTHIIAQDYGTGELKRYNLNKITEDSCKVLRRQYENDETKPPRSTC